MQTVKTKVKVIFDTDIGCDCDDAGALGVLNALADRGEAEIIAVTNCTANEYNAGCVDAINRYYGRKGIPVGTLHDPQQVSHGWRDVYGRKVAERYENGYKNAKACPGTVEVLRKALWENEDGDIVLVATGSMLSMSLLLNSKPDGICPLDGMQLVRQKVGRTVFMGGRFKQTWPGEVVVGEGYVVSAEFNIISNIKVAQEVCRDWPGELVFCSYEAGLYIITGKHLAAGGREDNPIKYAYSLHSGFSGRESWDLVTMLYAVRPDAGYWALHEYGRITVDDEGVTTWYRDEKCRHTYLLYKEDHKVIEDVLEELLDHEPEDGQSLQSP